MKKRHFKRKPIRADRNVAASPPDLDVHSPANTADPADSSVAELLPAIAAPSNTEVAPPDPEPMTTAPNGFKLQTHRPTEGEEAIAARLRERSKALHALRNT